jgi:hypothetical protein
MYVIEILGALICLFSIIKAFFNIIWIYYPLFLKEKESFNVLKATRFEKTLYIIVSILFMLHYIYKVCLKITSY